MKNYIKNLLNKKGGLTDPEALKELNSQIEILSQFDKQFDDVRKENESLKSQNETLKTDLIDALKNSAVGTKEAPFKQEEKPAIKKDTEIYKEWKVSNNEKNAQ